jgi:hypothetical protein
MRACISVQFYLRYPLVIVPRFHVAMSSKEQSARLAHFRFSGTPGANMQSELFRAKAEKCLRLAELSETEPVRLNLVAIARCWYEIALETRRAEQQYATAAN